MFLDITACLFVFVVTGTSATDIASSDRSVVLSEVLFVICKDFSHSDSISMSSILLELILVLLLWSMPHMFCLLSSGDFT